jgi:hypothetical protein
MTARNRIANIATNDPENDPTARVLLVREWIRNRGYCWHTADADGEIVAKGKTAEEADKELRWVYNYPAWDLQFGSSRTKAA